MKSPNARLTPDAYHATAALRPSDGAENQLLYALDARGHACGLRIGEKGAGDFMAAIRATRDQYPLEREAIEMHGYPTDAEGRGLSVLEVTHMHAPRKRRRGRAA